jgi:hypothetical protein
MDIVAPSVADVTGVNAFKVVYVVTVLAFMIERALAVGFELRYWIRLEEGLERAFGVKGLKELAATAVAYAVIAHVRFDAIADLFQTASTGGTRLLTALIIAGGSKGAVKLMQEVLDIRKPEIRALAAAKARSAK